MPKRAGTKHETEAAMHLQWILEGGIKRLGGLFLLVLAIPLFAVGLGLMLWGLSTALTAAIHTGPSLEHSLSIGVALVVLSVLMWVGSRRLDAAVRILKNRRVENALLRLAQQRGGRLTVIETAAETGYTAEEVALVLRRLSEQGFVEIEVTEAGVMVYRFPEIAYAPTPGGPD
jgi:hypothetical protein